ncbi:MAG: ABC transporter permease [Candidatus Sericytochromatia bacterium]|nr:ABC transporter permease [Candidatus Sericytochromatia bacterium]
MENILRPLQDKFNIIYHNKKAFFGFIVLSIYILTAIFGPLIVHLDMTTDYLNRFQVPSFLHWLGTDYAGRDTFAQIVHGSTDVMLISFSAAIIGTFLAILMGFLAGLNGGKIDTFIMQITDIFLTLPRFPIMAIFAGLFSIKDPISFGLLLGIFEWPSLARALRNQILSLKNKEFIEVCFIMNMPLRHIMFNELFPNMIPFIAVNFINMAKGAITASVGIMLLGIVPLSSTNWGMMLNLATTQTGAIYIPNAYAYLLSPIFFIVLFQFSLISFASGVEELFDPRLR